MSTDIPNKLKTLLQQLNTIIIGKQQQVANSVVCLLAGGHLLIEDVPGVGKTTLAQALAHSFGLHFSRVQFTSDLMPSDLTGVSIYDRTNESFVFHPGPVFSQVLLADEINRASPKTQSALLEAMEERQVSIEGQTRPLPSPFFVIATQNPQEQVGTYPLPESQLDRFLMKISLGYPSRAAEIDLLTGTDRRKLIHQLPAALNTEELLIVQRFIDKVEVAPPLLEYLLDLTEATRSGQWFVQGLSPRAVLAILRAARTKAMLAGRSYVVPEDVQNIFPCCASHRLLPIAGASRGSIEQIQAMMQSIPIR
ncbi:AAA family ATPase [Saezia sanguinis]|uniref:AAA family ATPase n=1 Tax=Saezia sanguinis TaxID=1965230 RepID=UPI003030FCCA